MISLPLAMELPASFIRAQLRPAVQPVPLLSYMGTISRVAWGPFHARYTAKHLHNPPEVLIIDTKNSSDMTLVSARYPNLPPYEHYWQLMRDSAFVFVLPGDRPYISRYVEAVCSGSVPVWVRPTEYNFWWAPPLSQVMPLETYSVAWNESDLHSLVVHLRALQPSVVTKLRDSAAVMCWRHVGSLDRIVNTVVDIAAQLA